MKKFSLIALSVAVSISIVAFIIAQNYAKFAQILTEVQPYYLLLSFLASAMTYVLMGLSLKEILRILDKSIGFLSSFSIAFVSTAVNYIVSTMGVSGFALRAHLLKKRNIEFGTSVTASIVISVLLYMVLAMFIITGAVFLILSSTGSRTQIVESIIAVVALISLSYVAIIVFFKREFRFKWVRRIFKLINKLLFLLSSPLLPRSTYHNFLHQLDTGINIIHVQKTKLGKTFTYIFLDWFFTLLVLYFSFMAVNIDLKFGELVAGFAIGMATTLIPILPSGLGAMELTMTAAFAQFDIPWEQALIACLIFRLAYYIIPALLSIPFFWGLKMSEPLDLKEEDEEIRKYHEEMEKYEDKNYD